MAPREILSLKINQYRFIAFWSKNNFISIVDHDEVAVHEKLYADLYFWSNRDHNSFSQWFHYRYVLIRRSCIHYYYTFWRDFLSQSWLFKRSSYFEAFHVSPFAQLSNKYQKLIFKSESIFQAFFLVKFFSFSQEADIHVNFTHNVFI